MAIQYYFIYKANQIYTAVRGSHYYRVVTKLRPDIYFADRQNRVHFHKFDERLRRENETVLEQRAFVSITDCFHWGGLNDQYAIMDNKTADLYMQAIKYWDQYTREGVRWRQETQLRHHIMRVNKVPFLPLEHVVGLNHTSFEYCIRRFTSCDWCSINIAALTSPLSLNKDQNERSLFTIR